MAWKIALAAAGAALLAPFAHLAVGAGDGVTVSGGAWTGASQVIPAPASGQFEDPAFQTMLRATAEAVCRPENDLLRNADRERACIADAIGDVEAAFAAGALHHAAKY